MWNVYFQKFGGEMFGDFIYAAYEGFNHRGKDYKLCFYEEIEKVPVNDQTIVVGCIEDTVEYFKKRGIEIPKALNIPEELKEYTKRKTWEMTMGEFKNSDIKLPIFLKPIKIKAFPSGVIKLESSKKLLFNDVHNSEEILVSETINMESEYRCFVRRGKLVGMKNYIGDFKLFPDIKVIEKAINEFKSAPISYSIDMAVTDKNETVLIECQDMWSIGNYGLDSEIYVSCLMDRWMQLIKRIPAGTI